MVEFDFQLIQNSRMIVRSVYIIDDIIMAQGTQFQSRKILSFGYYWRTHHNAKSKNCFELRIRYPQYSGYMSLWQFGVSYRIRCRQAEVQCQKNIDYADQIAAPFIKKGWVLIPHYINGSKDQGIEFFKEIVDPKINNGVTKPDLSQIDSEYVLPLVMNAIYEAKVIL
jgi:hypothetical protein